MTGIDGMQQVAQDWDFSLTNVEPVPLVSVVIAAFNAQAFIEQTCVSVLEQTYPSLEVIVVDDGSTDNTSEVVSSLARSDPRLRLIRQQNLGVAVARNTGIQAASGEFIAPLDADDLWAPTKIECQVRSLQRGGSGTGLSYCWWAWIDSNGRVLDRSPRWRIEGRVLQSLVEVNFTGSASVPLYRRSCIEELGGYSVNLRDQGCQGCEDWDLALRVAERYAVAVVPEVLVGYRRRTDSMSAQCETMWQSQMQVMAALAARQPSVSRTVFQRSSGQFALHLAGVAFWAGDYVQACRWALRARPLTLGFAVLPHVARLLARRAFRIDRSPPFLSTMRGHFDESVLSEPLIPYDRIYARHWRGRQNDVSSNL
ncbi:MAG: glycosyltransferase family 2 protein [Vicinamibacterales bacterium]